MRHSDARTTLQIYGHVVGDAQREVVEKIASIVDANGRSPVFDVGFDSHRPLQIPRKQSISLNAANSIGVKFGLAEPLVAFG
jgi:hypothetical protein